MTKKIIVDGQEFSSVEEMPPDVRRRYEQAMSALADRDGDGVPDIMQSGLSGMEDQGDGFHKVEVETRNEYVVDGEEYSSLDEMPPEAREMIGRMMRDMPAGGEGGGVHTFETEIIGGDTPGIRASGTRRIARRSGIGSPSRSTGGESPSRGRLGWFVALILGLALIWVLMAGCGTPSASENEQGPPPYSIPGTEVHTITSEAIGHDFQLYVALPASYGSSDARYPVVYSLDANVRELEALLRRREYPSLELGTHFFEGETHLSVVTSNFSRGLRTLYPPTVSGG